MKKKLLARYPVCNPRRLWRQDNFILSTFSPGLLSLKNDNEEASEKMRRSVKTCADAGFNLLELGWASEERGMMAVRMCEQLGIGVIYQNLLRYGGMGFNHVFCEKNDLLGTMRDMRCWKSVVGYYLWDEPTSMEQLHTTRKMMDLCQREQPETLPFTVALSSYSPHFSQGYDVFQKYINNFADIIDPPVLSFDYYPVGREEHDTVRQLDESYLWCDLEFVRQAAEARNIPYWFYYQGQNLHDVDFFIFPMVRLMLNAALLHGVKGLQQYTAWYSVVDAETGGPGIFFEDQKQIHAELRELGNTLMALQFRRLIHDDSLLPGDPIMDTLRTPMAESELLTGSLPYRTSVSEHTDAYGNRYLMVLNRDYLKEADITLDLKETSRVYAVSRKDGEQYVVADSTDQLQLHLIPGDLALLRIQPAQEEAFTVEYYLDKAHQPEA